MQSRVRRARHSTIGSSSLALLLLVYAGSAFAQSDGAAAAGLTEDRYADLVLAQSLDARIAASEAALGRAETVGIGIWPNPSLSWDREATPGSAGTSQDVIYASIPLVLSGRLGLEQDAAEQRAQAAQARADRTRAELRHQAVRAFHAVVVAQRRRSVLEASLVQLEQLAQTVAVRERAGAASGYESLRIDLERAAAATALAAARAQERRDGANALRLLGPSAQSLPPFSATVAADRPLPRLQVLLAALDGKRADLRALALEAQAATAARRAVDRSWVPEPTLNAGIQLIDTGAGRDTGYVVGVSVPLPFFERRQGEGARLAAARDLAEARRAALLHDARSRLVAAFEDVQLRRAQVSQHKTDVLARTDELRRIAAASYRGGASELLVLVDAERAAREALLTDLELAGAVAAAENDLLFLAGAYDAAHGGRTAP